MVRFLHNFLAEETMNANDVMTANPACCTSKTSLREVAGMFVEHDCGAIPVVNDLVKRWPVGIVTDRDIVCRVTALGKNALEMTAGDCMSAPCITVPPDTSLDGCCEIMESNKVRRILVVDESGACCGVISQADVALRGKENKAAEVVKEVSRPTTAPSAVSL
ncbi:MAG: CBS domain-containing protein [Acidobacteriota bacterium]